jgi:hypothetical protein
MENKQIDSDSCEICNAHQNKQIEEMAKVICHAQACEIKKNGGTCYKGCKAYIYAERAIDKGYRKADEVAEEIFEEIEKIRGKEIHKCETLREKANDASECKYWEGGEHSLRQLSYWIAELKKKYTVTDINVGGKTEEENERDTF